MSMLILGKVNYSGEWQLLRQCHPSQATRPQPPSSPDSPAPQRISPTPLCVSLIPHCQHLTTPEGTTTHQKEEVKINQICFSMSNFCSTEIWQSLQFNLLNKRDIRSRNSQNESMGPQNTVAQKSWVRLVQDQQKQKSVPCLKHK